MNGFLLLSWPIKTVVAMIIINDGRQSPSHHHRHRSRHHRRHDRYKAVRTNKQLGRGLPTIPRTTSSQAAIFPAIHYNGQ